VTDRSDPLRQVGFVLLLLLLVFAPLFRAANRPLPLLALELGAVLLLYLLLWNPGSLKRLPVPLLLLGSALALIPLLQLLPLPAGLWDGLPGREPYAATWQLAAGDQRPGWSSISIIAGRTEQAFYQTLPVLAVFATAYLLPVERVNTLVLAVLALAGLQAALGLVQFGDGPHSLWYFGQENNGRSAIGTYANRDHLAGLLEMVFPVALALFVANLRRSGRHRRKPRGNRWRRRLQFVATAQGHQAAVYGVLAVLLLLGLIFTRSRTGVALAMLGLLVALPVFARRLGGSNVYGTLGTVAAVVVVLAAEIGLTPILERFAHDPLADARWTFFATSMDGIGGFFPLGSGAGTYPALYPLFQPVEFGHIFVNHAHNDFIEALFEGGAPALLIMGYGLFLYLRQWPRVWKSGRWGEFRFVQAGAGIGLFLILLHSLVDFNMQIPANALFAAFLLAVFMKDYREDTGPRRRRRRTPGFGGTPSGRAEGDAATGTVPPPPQPAPEHPPQRGELIQQPVREDENPFLSGR
jgi:O-antigen ligase